MRKLCRKNFDSRLVRIMEMNSGIKSKCSLGRNQRRYRRPNRSRNGHIGVFHAPGVTVEVTLFAWTGCTTSDRKTLTPSEEGCAFSITNSSKFDMKVNAFVKVSSVASIL